MWIFKNFVYYMIKAAIAAGGFAILWLIGFVFFIHSIPHQFNDDQIVTDGIVIFTWGDTRLKVALELAQKRLAPYLLISGVDRDNSLQTLLKQNGIKALSPQLKVTLGYNARDTLGNADETAKWAAKNNIKTLRLVTSNYHLPRSLLELKRQAPNLILFPYPVIGEGFKKPQWWLDPKVMLMIVEEYQKYLYALVRQPFKKK